MFLPQCCVIKTQFLFKVGYELLEWDHLSFHLMLNNLSIWESLIKTEQQTQLILLIIKPTRCTNFSNLFLEWNSTCFRQFLCPSSGVFHRTHNNGICHTGLLTACSQTVSKTCVTFTIVVCRVKNSRWWTEQEQAVSKTCMTYTIAVCKVKISLWWTQELSETCSFIPKINLRNKCIQLVWL